VRRNAWSTTLNPATPSEIGASFDARAATYNGNVWHQLVAEQLVSLSGIGPGHVVVDAATGTGFAAIAASPLAGPAGRVIAVDLSAGMLDVARRHAGLAGDAPIEWLQADASALSAIDACSIDVVTCAAGLLYMPVRQALDEWARILKPGGRVAFTSMVSGFPIPGRIFRECAEAFGVHLTDPSALLGSEAACRSALETSRFSVALVTRRNITFSSQDIGHAWTSNVESPAHAAVRAIGTEALARMQAAFEAAMRREELSNAAGMSNADVLFAVGARLN
jgi:ubiquinone/menaquinone biosynthesis C-methylase UbiE